MTKERDQETPLEKARRKVARAQLKLHVAQEEAAQARESGKQEIEQARLRAAKMLAKAAERVERRSQKLVSAEERLRSVIAKEDMTDTPEKESLPTTAEAAADILEEREAAAQNTVPAELLTV